MVYEKMDRYTLSKEGRWRFMRIREDKETVRFEGYEIIDYLYDNGARTIEEIINYTGLSQNQVVDKIQALISQRFVEKLVGPRFLQ